MISMPMIESIRDMSRRGLANADIQRETGISQPTIRKHLAMDDFSPKMPTASGRGSMLDPYKPFVDAVLEADRQVWRKQRHTCQADLGAADGGDALRGRLLHGEEVRPREEGADEGL